MESGKAQGRMRARWSAAGVLVAGLAVAASVSGFTSHLRVCVKSTNEVASCRPMDISDLHVVAIFVLVALLLLPDLSRVKIGGVLELERMIAEASRKVEVTDAKIERVLQQMAAVSFANSHSDASASNAQNMTVNVLASSATQLDEDSMARKAREGLGVD